MADDTKIKLSNALVYTANPDGSIAVSLLEHGPTPHRFNSYSFSIRTRVRIGFTLGHHAQEEQKLHAAWDKSPQHYLAVLDDVLCARAEAILKEDVRQQCVMEGVETAMANDTFYPKPRKPERDRER